MNKTGIELVTWLNQSTEKLLNNLSTREAEEREFVTIFSRAKLLECLADPDCDAEDNQSIKEMLQYFYNYTVETVS